MLPWKMRSIADPDWGIYFEVVYTILFRGEGWKHKYYNKGTYHRVGVGTSNQTETVPIVIDGSPTRDPLPLDDDGNIIEFPVPGGPIITPTVLEVEVYREVSWSSYLTSVLSK